MSQASPAFSLSKFFFLTLLVFVVSSCERAAPPRSYFPEIGKDALHQRTLDLGNDLKVLSLAHSPGYEDLAGLAYFRFGRGAQIMSAYLSNGEGGESDVRGELPPYLAANLRQEAEQALAHLGGDTYFLNMPDLVAAHDSATVRESWASDSLQTRLLRLLSSFRPDLILVARTPSMNLLERNWAHHCLLADLLVAVQRADTLGTGQIPGLATGPWKVASIWSNAGEGQSLPVDQVHPLWKKNYSAFAEEAGRAYSTIVRQRQAWKQLRDPSYIQLWPEPAAANGTLDAGLPLAPTKKLSSLERRVQRLANVAREGKNNKESLWEIASLRDSVSVLLAEPAFLQSFERRRLLHWNKQLEDLRCTLLGVEVKFTVSDTAVTERQVTFVKIDNVTGLSDGGQTHVLFGFMERGWVVDENFENKLPLRLDPPYRLLSPENLPYTFPPAMHAQQAQSINKSVLMFVIHQAGTRENSFVHRTEIKMQYAPPFVAEVLTPIVPMAPREKIALQFTNFSRDGVMDTLKIENELATSTPRLFRLPGKGKVYLDTVEIFWQGTPAVGSYLIPLKIADAEVANFAARKFEVKMDRNLKVGVLSGIAQSPTLQALRRLGLEPVELLPGANWVQQLAGLEVLILDRRALTLRMDLSEVKNTLATFMANSGRVLVLSQDAQAWRANPLGEGLKLTPTQNWDARIAVRESGLAQPNKLGAEDWAEWLFLRAYNQIELTSSSSAILLQTESGAPLIVAQPHGAGGLIYVELALAPQWLNIHAGAFRLLANLLSYSFER